MSNKLRLRGRPLSERCSFCGRAAGGVRALRMRDGSVACLRCQEHGGGLLQLACGHAVPASTRIWNVNGDGRTFVCGLHKEMTLWPG